MDRRCDVTQKVLHQKYGEVVFLGPNVVSLSNPRWIKTLYRTNNSWLKVCTPRGVVMPD